MEFNEEDAIKYIISRLGEGYTNVDEDEILNIIDIIWDYYDDKGLLDLSNDEDTDVDDLIAHAKKVTAKDKECPFTPEEVENIVRYELEYEKNTLEI